MQQQDKVKLFTLLRSLRCVQPIACSSYLTAFRQLTWLLFVPLSNYRLKTDLLMIKWPKWTLLFCIFFWWTIWVIWVSFDCFTIKATLCFTPWTLLMWTSSSRKWCISSNLLTWMYSSLKQCKDMLHCFLLLKIFLLYYPISVDPLTAFVLPLMWKLFWWTNHQQGAD